MALGGAPTTYMCRSSANVPFDWCMSLLCVFRSRDVAFKLASCFVNKKHCVGLRKASRTVATCMAEVCSALVRPKVLVWRGDEPAQEAVDIFDPVFKTWDTFPSAHQYREEAVLAVINERFYACGGPSGDPDPPSTALDCFDPFLGSWQTSPPMSQ